MADEETLVHQATQSLEALHDQLRRGQSPRIDVEHQELAHALSDVAADRTLAAAKLATFLGISTTGITLTKIAEQLPQDDANELLLVRERLKNSAVALLNAQRRAANLAHYLRSYFRSVVTAWLGGEGPTRYTRFGSLQSMPGGVATLARG